MIIAVWRILLFLWLGSTLFVISLPWRKFDGTPHWDNVQWIPFNGYLLTASTLIETGANFLAFVPVGYLTVRSMSRAGLNPILFALLLGFCSSVSIEFYQLLCYDRVPSTTDVLLNVLGTAIGAWLAFAIDHVLAFFFVQARRLTA